MNTVSQSELGKKSAYQDTYQPDLLFPIPRDTKRLEIGIEHSALPFHGFDAWQHYEVSWLNPKGKPMVAMAEMIYDCTSPNIIESKSMKLYFNSLNQSHFESLEALQHIIQKNLSEAIQAPVTVLLHTLPSTDISQQHHSFDGICLDDLDITCDTYSVQPDFLTTHDSETTESLHSNLLKSNCLVTEQPDWGSVLIQYEGRGIDHEGLLRYIVSFRQHNEFHEQCIERIYTDIMSRCQPTSLLVYGRYTRRGGIEINPLRASHPVDPATMQMRLVRQ